MKHIKKSDVIAIFIIFIVVWLSDSLLTMFLLTHEFIQCVLINPLSPIAIKRACLALIMTVTYMLLFKTTVKKNYLNICGSVFKETIQKAPFGALVSDINGNFLFFNERFTEMTGYTIDQIKTFDDWFRIVYPDPEYCELVKKAWDNDLRALITKESRVVNNQVKIRCSENQNKYLSLSASYAKDFVIISAEDVTEHILTKDALLQQQRELRQIINSVPHFIYIKDENRKVYMINNALAEFFGCAVSDIEGNNEINEKAVFEDEERFIRTDMQIINGEVDKLEYIEKVTYKDGRSTWFMTIKVPFYTNNNKRYVLGISVDVSELLNKDKELIETSTKLEKETIARMISDKRLLETQETLSRIVYNSPNLFFSMDPDLNLTFISPQVETILGYKPDEINDNFDWIFINSKTRAYIRNSIKRALETREEQPHYTIELRKRNGEKLWAEIRETPIIEDGKAVAVIGLIVDVTKNKQAETEIYSYQENLESIIEKRTSELEERTKRLTDSQRALTYLLEDVNSSQKKLEKTNKALIAANKELEAFSYSISHDLRTPLRAINSFAKLLADEYSHLFDDEAFRMFNIIRENSIIMSNLINDLLAFSKLGLEKVEKVPVDMETIIKDEYKSAVNFLDYPIELRMETIHSVIGDKHLLKQVWTNLISNAIKYSRNSKPSIITITSKEDSESVTYMISDNGVGFDTRYKDKLFGVFQRLHSVKDFEGTGVGLAIAHRIVQKHSGTIDADSDGKTGATFMFTLPKK